MKQEYAESASSDVMVESPGDVTMIINKSFFDILKSTYKVFANMLQHKFEINELQKEWLKNTESNMDILFHTLTCTEKTDSDFGNTAALAYSSLHMCYIYNMVNERNNFNISIKYLIRCLLLIEGKEMDRRIILLAMSANIEMFYKWKTLKNFAKCRSTLKKAITLYLQFTKEKDDYLPPINIVAILGFTKYLDFKFILDGLYLFMLYKLTDLLEDDSSNSEQGILPLRFVYIHKILAKELQLKTTGKLIWATKSTVISDTFTSYGYLTVAKNHIMAAEMVLKEFKMQNEITDDLLRTSLSHNILYINYIQTKALIAFYWAKYGTTLLRLSRERLLQQMKCNLCKDCSKCLILTHRPAQELMFNNIKEKHSITDEYISNYSHVKTTFLKILLYYYEANVTNILDESRMFYSLTDIGISLGTSQAYKYFTYFKQNKNEQIQQYESRIKVLKRCLKSKNLRTNLDINGYKIIIELTTVYSALVDIMTEHLHAGDELTAKESSKVNYLAMSNLKLLKLYSQLYEPKV